MKKILHIGLALATLCLAFTACKKSDDSGTSNPVVACTGGNLCFTLDGQDYVFNTKLEQMSANKYRIATTDAATGDNWKRVEIYFFGDGTPGDYKFDFTSADKTASMLYFGKEAGVSFQYMTEDTGAVKIVTNTGGKWSGTFSGTMGKQGTSNHYKLTSGKFASVGN